MVAVEHQPRRVDAELAGLAQRAQTLAVPVDLHDQIRRTITDPVVKVRSDDGLGDLSIQRRTILAMQFTF
jgi:hypothetical protein